MQVETSTGDTFDADMHVYLWFWPQGSMINAIKELHHTGDTLETPQRLKKTTTALQALTLIRAWGPQ